MNEKQRKTIEGAVEKQTKEGLFTNFKQRSTVKINW